MYIQCASKPNVCDVQPMYVSDCTTDVHCLSTFAYEVQLTYSILGVSGPLLCIADMSPFLVLEYYFHYIKHMKAICSEIVYF